MTTLKKIKKHILNIQSGLLLFSLVPTFILILFISLAFSSSQYQKTLSQAENKFSKAVQEINTTFDQAMQFSIKAISNPSLVNIFEKDYDNMNSNYQSAQSLSMFFSNYLDSYSDSQNSIVFYHNNYSMYRSSFSKYIDVLDQNLVNQLKGFDLSDMLWIENEEYFLFYKATNTADTVLISEYKIPKSMVDEMIDKFDVLINDNYNIENEFTLSSAPQNYSHTYSKSLLNGMYINLCVPNSLKYQIYSVNIILFGFIYVFLALVLFLFTKIFANRFKYKMSIFIDAIAENDDLSDISSLSYGQDNVLSPVYNKLIELITGINELHEQYNKITAEKNLSELKYIQSKFNPHLLYNTLSVLKWKCMKYDDSLAGCIDTMVDYYRACINTADVIQLADEIDLIKKYINIVEFTYARKYDVIFEIDEGLLKLKTIKHILQPFVENAILHGISEKPDGYILIKAYTENGFVVLKVIDNGNCITPERLAELKKPDYFSEYKSFGIKNTSERIKLFHGENSEVTVESTMNETTCITIKIPLESE